MLRSTIKNVFNYLSIGLILIHKVAFDIDVCNLHRFVHVVECGMYGVLIYANLINCNGSP